MNNLIASTPEFGYPTLAISGAKIAELTQSLVDAGISYRMGAKIEPLSLQASDLVANGIDAVDCSGMSRWLTFHSLGQPADFNMVDGSVEQHQQFIDVGFKVSDYEDAKNKDGIVRVAFLKPIYDDAGLLKEAGHVLFIWNGTTYESHGGVGPGTREWDAEQHPFINLMIVYMVALP